MYEGTVRLELYDRVSGRPEPITTAVIDVTFDKLPDPMQSLTVAALEQAVGIAKIAIAEGGGHIPLEGET